MPVDRVTRFGPTHEHDDESCGEGRIIECGCPCPGCEIAKGMLDELPGNVTDVTHEIVPSDGVVRIAILFDWPLARAS